MVDQYGRRVEIIVLDMCDGHGPQPWIRVSWHRGVLLGRGYYRPAELNAALALVDVGSLVEIIDLRSTLAAQVQKGASSAMRLGTRR
jgi:hypothetical protein